MIEIKKLKSGSYIIHKDMPYRVIKNQIVVTGTHSHTKNRLDIQSLMNDKYESLTYPPHEHMDDVDIIRKKAQLLALSEDRAQIMDMVSYETHDAAVKENLDDLNEGDEVSYIEFRGNAFVIDKWKR